MLCAEELLFGLCAVRTRQEPRRVVSLRSWRLLLLLLCLERLSRNQSQSQSRLRLGQLLLLLLFRGLTRQELLAVGRASSRVLRGRYLHLGHRNARGAALLFLIRFLIQLFRFLVSAFFIAALLDADAFGSAATPLGARDTPRAHPL